MRDEHSVTAGGAIFGKLKALGVDYVFANSGTDFPPIIEGLIEAQALGLDLPTPVTVPHENVAVGMAHGNTMMTGRAQAVMLHTNVGLANGVNAIINAACDSVPMMLMSGRTPVMEGARFGARTVPIGWGQEMYDQSALVRGSVKWDYELRFPEQVPDVMERGWAVANSTPQGPVYLSLPREVLCEPCPRDHVDTSPRMAPTVGAPDPAALQAAARAIAEARNPLIIAQRGPGSQEAFDALTKLAEKLAIPVSHYWANQISIPASSPMYAGWALDELLVKADVILVIDALAPWMPDRAQPGDDATIIHLGPDPLFAQNTPIRNFRSDISLAGETAPSLLQLIAAIDAHAPDETAIAERRATITGLTTAEKARNRQVSEDGRETLTKDWVGLCLAEALKGLKATVLHELGCPLPSLCPEAFHSYFQEPHSGGLGWSLPAAMGAQLADPDQLIVATLGDGSYMFCNPTVCHQVAEALDLPIIAIVLNNGEWGAVRRGVVTLYEDGLGRKANEMPLTSLRPSPDFAKTAEASRAYAETITNGDDLPAALDRAIKVATTERRQVLLDIHITGW